MAYNFNVIYHFFLLVIFVNQKNKIQKAKAKNCKIKFFQILEIEEYKFNRKDIDFLTLEISILT